AYSTARSSATTFLSTRRAASSSRQLAHVRTCSSTRAAASRSSEPLTYQARSDHTCPCVASTSSCVAIMQLAPVKSLCAESQRGQQLAHAQTRVIHAGFHGVHGTAGDARDLIARVTHEVAQLDDEPLLCGQRPQSKRDALAQLALRRTSVVPGL